MAKQLLINGLRRALAGYVEEGAQLEAQVANGRLELRDISLRRDLLEGLGDALGCRVVPSGAGIARLSVRWSWTGLLTSPLEVTLEDLQISVAVSPSVPSQSAGVRMDSTQVSRPTSGLARRLWDQLRLNVRGLQLKCEVFSKEEAEPSPGTVGVLLERLEVAAAKTEDGLVQSVQLEGLGVFLLPPAEHEAKEHFLLRPLTSSSRAVRSSGRRFVDHRGLELKLELGSPELRLNQEQVKCLPQLRRCLSEIISGPPSAGSIAEPTKTEAGPQAGPRGTSGAGQQANSERTSSVQRKSSWLPSLTLSWWTSARSSSEAPPDEVPEGLSESDRAIIVSEEAPAGDTAEFRLVVSWAEASLLTPDEQLSMRGSGSMTCVVPASGAWSLECGLSGSLWDRLASRPVCACRQAAAGHDLLLQVQSRSLKLVVNPMDLAPTRAAVAAARFLVEVASAVPREAAEEVAEALDAAEAAVSVSIESPRLLLGAEHTEEQLVAETSCCTLERRAGQSLCSLKEVRVALPHFPGVSNEPMSLSMRSSHEGLHWEIPSANISVSLVDLVPAYLASAKLFGELLSESGDVPVAGGSAEEPQSTPLQEAAWRLSVSVASFRLSLLSATSASTVIFEGGLEGSRGIPHWETRLDLGMNLLMQAARENTPRELAGTSRWSFRSNETGTVVKCEDSLNLTCQNGDLLVLRSFVQECSVSLRPLQATEAASAGTRTGAVELVVPQGTISVSFGACAAQLQGSGHYRVGAGDWSASCRFAKVFIQHPGDAGGVPVLTERAPGDVLCLLATPASLEVSLQPVALSPTPAVLQAVSSFCEELQSNSDPGGLEECQGCGSPLLRVSAVRPRILLRGDSCRLVAMEAGSVSLEWKEGRWTLEAGACSLGMVKADPASASAQLAPVLLEPTNCSLSLQAGKEAQLLKVDSAILRFRPEDLACLHSAASTWLAEDCLPPVKKPAAAAAGGEAHLPPFQVEVTALRACLVNSAQDLVIAGSLSGFVNVRDSSWQSSVKLSLSLAEGETRQMVLQECSWDLRWSGSLLEVSCAAFALDCTSRQLSTLLILSLPWQAALGKGRALTITETASARGGEDLEQGKPITLRVRGCLGAKAATSGCWSAQLGLSHFSVLDEDISVCSLREQAQQGDCGISILADSRSVQVRLGPIDVCPTEAAATAMAMLLPNMAAATRAGAAGAAAANEAQPGGLSISVECELPRLLLPGGPSAHDTAELLFKAARCAVSLEPGGQSWSLRVESAQVELARPRCGTQATSILEASSVVLAQCNGERSCSLATAQVHLGPTDASSIISAGSRLAELAELLAGHTGTDDGPAPRSTHRLSAKAVGLTVTLSRLPGSSAVLMLVGDVDVSRPSSGGADLAFRFSVSLGASSAAPRLICRSRWGLSLREHNLWSVKSLECLALQCQSSDVALLQSFHKHFLPEQRQASASASEGSTNQPWSLEVVVPEAKVVLELSEAVRIEAEGKAHLSVGSSSTSGTGSWTLVAGLSKVFLRDRAEQRPVLSRRLGGGVQADFGDVVAVRANGQTMEVVTQAMDLAPTPGALQAVHRWLQGQAGLQGQSAQEGQPALDIQMKSPRVLLHSGGHVATLEAGTVRVARQAAAPMTVNVEACRLLLESPAGSPPCIVLEPTTWALSLAEKVVALQAQTVTVRILPSHLPGFRSIAARLSGDLLQAISDPGGRGTGAPPLKCSLGSLKLLLGSHEVLELSGRLEGGSTLVPGGSDLQFTAGLSISLGQQTLVQGSRWDLTWTSSQQQLHLLNAELAFRLTSFQMRALQQSMMSWWSAWGSSPSTAAAGSTTTAAGSGATQVKLSLQRVTGTILDEATGAAMPCQTQTATVLLEGTSVVYNAGSLFLGLGRAELGLEGVLGHLCLTSLELSGAMPRYRASLSLLELLDVDGNRAVQACNLSAVATGNSIVQDPLSPNVRDIEVSGSLDGVVVDTTDRFLRPLAEAMQHFGLRIAEVCGGNSQAMEFGAKVEVLPLKVEVRRFAFEDSKVGLQVESAIIQLQRVSLAERRTTFSSLRSSFMGAYKTALQAHAPRLVASISVGGFGVGDAAYASLGSAVGQLAIGCGSLGSALGCAAVKGAAAALDASKTKGKELRGGSEDYQFGDVTRGLASAAMRPAEVASATANFVKEEKVASSTVGAVLGTTVGVVAGPVGCVAGAAAGSAVGRKLSDTVASTIERGKEARGGDRGYHFGDFTRGLVAGSSAGGHGAGPQNQQRPGKWRYDDINPIAKVNPLRFSCKPTVQDLWRDIAERAEPGRPIYVELEASGTPYCRVLRERSAAVAWLQSLQPESPSRGSETSRSNQGDMLLRPSTDSVSRSTVAVKNPSFPPRVAPSGLGPEAALQRQQPDLMDLGPADLGLGQVSSGHGPVYSTRSQRQSQSLLDFDPAERAPGTGSGSAGHAHPLAKSSLLD